MTITYFLLLTSLAFCLSTPSLLAQSKSDLKKYQRSYFSGWKDEDGNCLDTRSEILKVRSKGIVTYKKVRGRDCKVLTGQWDDFYYNEVLTKSSQIDLDHLVPLKHAWQTGAASWEQGKRDRFATDPENLVITNRSYNRQKGAKTILQWMPVDRTYACRYLEQWFYIKMKYDMAISQEEKDHRKLLDCTE